MRKRRFIRTGLSAVLSLSMVLSMAGMDNVASAAAKKVKLNKTKVTVSVGKKVSLKVKNAPKKAKFTWKTNKKKVAKVSKKGKVTAVSAGTAKITCKVTYKKNGRKVNKKLTCKVTVKAKAVPTLPPSSAPTTGGAIVPSAAPSAAAPSAQAPTQEPTENPNAIISFTPCPTYGGDIHKDTNVGEEHEVTLANGRKITVKDNGSYRTEPSTMDLINTEMGMGWNLGNQMEQSNLAGTRGFESVEAGETSAGNPVATQKTFDGLKAYGVNTVRIPCAWSNFMAYDPDVLDDPDKADEAYKIDPDYLSRVEEVVNLALNDGMYVIMNIHWDGGWWGRFGAEEWEDFDIAQGPDPVKTPKRYAAWVKFTRIWEQLSDTFGKYSDHLIFEGANEELSGRLNDDYLHPEKGQANQTGLLPKDGDAVYTLACKISQQFVNVVRASAKKEGLEANQYRHLLIPGSGNESCVIGGTATEDYKNDGTCDERFKMPEDPQEDGVGNKLSISVHVYDPTDYGLSATSTTTWGYRDSWGTKADYQWLENYIGRMKKFTKQGYGVIMGECGCVKGYKDNVIQYLSELFGYGMGEGYCPVLWDEGHYYNREDGYFAYDDVGQLFAYIAGEHPTLPEGAVTVNTGISVVPTVENQNPKVCYTWTGHFMRHTGDGEIPGAMAALWGWKSEGGLFDDVQHGIGVTDSVSDGMEAIINEEYWNIHFQVDWSQIKEPCIRVYPMDNETSQGCDLQVGYQKKEKGSVKFDVDYDQSTGQFWTGKYIKLRDEVKGGYPWVWITTNTYTGASYVKIEVCDGAYNADGTEYQYQTETAQQ